MVIASLTNSRRAAWRMVPHLISSPHHEHLNVFILHLSPISIPQTMPKRLIQEGKPGEDERAVAKSKPARNLVSKTLNRFPTALSSSKYISKPGESYSNKFNLGYSRYGEARSDESEREQRIKFSRQPDVNPNFSTGISVAKSTKNTVGTRLVRPQFWTYITKKGGVF